MYFQEEIETMPREQLRELQLERMKKSIRHAYDNVDFYKKSFAEAGVTPDDLTCLEDLAKFPFTVKTDLRDTYPFGLFAVKLKDVVRLHASSGTTGKQIVVGYTRHDLEIWNDCCARALTAAEMRSDAWLAGALFVAAIISAYGICVET